MLRLRFELEVRAHVTNARGEAGAQGGHVSTPSVCARAQAGLKDPAAVYTELLRDYSLFLTELGAPLHPRGPPMMLGAEALSSVGAEALSSRARQLAFLLSVCLPQDKWPTGRRQRTCCCSLTS